MSAQHRHVVIIGGGFGGLSAVQALARHPVQITVIDRTNHHTFQPLLYQVATTVLSPGQIAAPLRIVLHRHRNVDVVLGEVTGVDLGAHRVKVNGFEVGYDHLIVSTGARHSYLGHAAWEPLAPGLKTVEDALEIRRRVLLVFELAERDALMRPKQRRAPSAPQGEPINFVVIGGGPTGVELAGALADMARRALAKDFRAIDPKRAGILLLEGGPRVLPSFPEDLSRKAEEQLRRLGVEVQTSTFVTGVEPGIVRTGNASFPSSVTLWATGVAASPLGVLLSDKVDRAGRVFVAHDLSLPDHPEVFVIGDLAAFLADDGHPLPGLAAVAAQQGKAAAENIWRDLQGRSRVPFRYVNKGTLAAIGRKAAVVDFGRVHLSGVIAWAIWLFVHILLLVGFRNRLMVLREWAWAYFTRERSGRLITGSTMLPGWHEGQEMRTAAGYSGRADVPHRASPSSRT